MLWNRTLHFRTMLGCHGHPIHSIDLPTKAAIPSATCGRYMLFVSWANISKGLNLFISSAAVTTFAGLLISQWKGMLQLPSKLNMSMPFFCLS